MPSHSTTQLYVIWATN